jgi:hypothetical protein
MTKWSFVIGGSFDCHSLFVSALRPRRQLWDGPLHRLQLAVPDPVLTKQTLIAELAKQAPSMSLTTLAHHVTRKWLYEAYLRTRKSGATGVDGQTAAEYAENLANNLQGQLDRVKSGTYQAPPVRRAYIPNGTGTETRPIGIPTFE